VDLILQLEDGGIIFLRNIVIYLQDYAVSTQKNQTEIKVNFRTKTNLFLSILLQFSVRLYQHGESLGFELSTGTDAGGTVMFRDAH
jgi:hypothetical protein